MTPCKLDLHIRWMPVRDLPTIVDIERRCFPDPWTPEEFLKVLRMRTCIGMVAEAGNEIAGYMVYDLQKTKIELLNLAVDRPFRWQGVGTQLVDKLKTKIHPSHRKFITLDVRETNLPALLFLRSQGFRATAIKTIHQWNDLTDDDVIAMTWRAGDR